MKKLLLLLCALLTAVGGVKATDVTVLPANGVYWKNGAVSSDPWAPIWKSTATASDLSTPLLTFEGQTGMNTANGNIYSNQTYTLTAPSGYVIVGYTFNGTATGADITITPAGGSGTTVASGKSLDTPLSVDVNAQTTTFALASSGDAHFESLALTVKVEHYVITYGTGTGSYNSTTANYVNTWTSTATDPQVTLSVSGGANNIQRSNGYLYSGTAKSSIYTIAVQAGYLVTGYEIKGRAQTNAQTLTPAGGTAVSFGTDKEYTLSVTGLSAASVTFTQAGENTGIAISSFKVFLEDAVSTVTYVISDANGVVFTSDPFSATPGETVTELPAAVKRDYCSYSAINQTMAEGENTVNVTVSYNLPFESGTGKLYYAKLRNHYAYYDATNSDVRTNQSSKENTDNYRWSFSGNPYSGIKMKNEAAGTYLDNTSNTVQLTAGGYAWTIKSLNNTTTFGLFNGTNYINEQNHSNHNLIYYSKFTDDTGSQWNIEEVPAEAVDVTYNLDVGGQVVNTIVVEEVAANSEVSVPTALTAAYSPLCYDFATSGTIGSTDCTITVTATPKTGFVTALSELSNSKAYTLTTARGALYIKTDHLASNSNANVGATAGNFAVISFEGNYYLYSTDASKFVQRDGSLSENVTSNVVAVSLTAQSTKNLFLMKIGSNGVNITDTSNDYEVVINAHVTPDAGNQYAIFEAADFDATDALAALDEYFKTAFANAIAQLEAYPYGTGVNQYSLVVESTDYTTQASTIISGLKGQGYSADNLATAQLLIAGTTLNTNVPAGFYRIKGKTSGNYLAAGIANNKYAMSSATDATTIFYYDGTMLVNFSSGMANGMSTSSWDWVTGDAASTVVFADGGSNGGYTFKSANAFFYDGGTNADRGSSLNTDAKYRNWYLTEVTTLPVTITAAGYATLYAPVALTIPTGVTAYYISELTKTEATLTEISTTIPANTPVILKGNEGDYNFAITTAEDFNGTNKLSGQVAAQTVAKDVAYTLQKNKADANIVGLYPKAAGTIAGFKAYLLATALPATTFSAGVKGFTFNFGDLTTAISAIERANSQGAIYDLSGRRVSKAQKGIYIIGGKKVTIK